MFRTPPLPTLSLSVVADSPGGSTMVQIALLPVAPILLMPFILLFLIIIRIGNSIGLGRVSDSVVSIRRTYGAIADHTRAGRRASLAVRTTWPVGIRSPREPFTGAYIPLFDFSDAAMPATVRRMNAYMQTVISFETALLREYADGLQTLPTGAGTRGAVGAPAR
jgi:hypothetical protein